MFAFIQNLKSDSPTFGEAFLRAFPIDSKN